MKRILSTALAIVVFISAAQAQPDGKHQRKGGEMMQALNLTTDQKEKIKTIREAEKTEMKALKNNGKTEADKEARKQLHDKYKSQIESVLTADQKAKMKDAKKDGHREGFGKGDKAGKMKAFAEELNLTADQKAKLSVINSDFKTKMQALRSNTALSQEDKKAQLKQLSESHKNSLKFVLTQEQITKMEESRKAHKNKGNRNL